MLLDVFSNINASCFTVALLVYLIYCWWLCVVAIGCLLLCGLVLGLFACFWLFGSWRLVFSRLFKFALSLASCRKFEVDFLCVVFDRVLGIDDCLCFGEFRMISVGFTLFAVVVDLCFGFWVCLGPTCSGFVYYSFTGTV